MNSPRLHCREAIRSLAAADSWEPETPQAAALFASAQVHALLACATAIVEMTRQTSPQPEVVDR